MEDAKVLLKELKSLMGLTDTQSEKQRKEIFKWFKEHKDDESQALLDQFIEAGISEMEVEIEDIRQELFSHPEGLRKSLKNIEEYNNAVARVEQLLPLIDESTPPTDINRIELEYLSNLVADYSDKHFAIEKL